MLFYNSERTLMKLKRSNDRKVTNAVSKNGKTPTIANTFGLPAGKNFSCPGATNTCESVCYAGKLERVYKGVRAVLLHNWELLKDADIKTMETLLSDMIEDFVKDCEKKDAPKLFRIHWDGDFFNDTYTYAWKNTINKYPDVKFWVYTRVPAAVAILLDIPNLSLYFSTDKDNKEIAIGLNGLHGVRLAYLADTFAIGQADMKAMIGRVGAKCPENKKAIPLIDTNGSACVKCSLCIDNKADIVFSAKKK
jgi:ferredoxin